MDTTLLSHGQRVRASVIRSHRFDTPWEALACAVLREAAIQGDVEWLLGSEAVGMVTLMGIGEEVWYEIVSRMDAARALDGYDEA